MQSDAIIEPFQPSDAPHVITLWNNALEEEPSGRGWYSRDHWLTETRLDNILRNPNYDPHGSLVCRVGERVVGYARAVIKRIPANETENLDECPAYFEGLVIAPAWRGRGLGKRLLAELRNYAKAGGKQTLQSACWYSPLANFYVPADSPAERFLVAQGFEPSPRELRLRLQFERFHLQPKALEARAKLAAEGIVVIYCDPSTRDSFSELARTEFDSWWYLMFRPNLEQDRPRPVLVAAEGTRVAGFIGFADVKEDGFADFVLGVSQNYRRRGIASVLVNAWCAEMKAKGALESQIDTGAQNPAQHIYLDAGFEKFGLFSVHLTRKLA